MPLFTMPPSTHRALLFVALLVSLLCCHGCVRRRMTILSNPAGAVVFVDDRRVGVTPVSTSFTYYGTRKIQLFKDGFESQTVKQRFFPPWYQFPPIDFITDNFWPQEIRDERIVEFEMTPQLVVPPQELVGRAESLRGSANQGNLIGLPPATSPPPAPQAAPQSITPAHFEGHSSSL